MKALPCMNRFLVRKVMSEAIYRVSADESVSTLLGTNV